ncbi:hypothetical protein [Halomonas salinarum]|uniref:hypothetical protein n=1 Tax=Halomonas salinarum TaxID=1158993 RepID=UPI0014398393|nr:hypothetical protein [Halomonas salinarum]
MDLTHAERFDLAADIARWYQAETCHIRVTTPGALAKTPKEYAVAFEAFANEQGRLHGQEVSTKVITSQAPVADMDAAIIQAIDDTLSFNQQEISQWKKTPLTPAVTRTLLSLTVYPSQKAQRT